MQRVPILIGSVALLVALGVALHTANFTSYLGDDPAACNNCHVMDTAYESWFHGSHARWATCNDCHTPHEILPKYMTKTEAGFRHVSAFVLGDIPPAIRARESSRQIVQENCIRCHQATVEDVLDGAMKFDTYCFECHRQVAHGARGIALSPLLHQEGSQ
ncbi:MAG: cytochrome c nitrite reductase small subunit [Ardenticatenia bacterium]|nr:MAG: cytochrome c nitrite reductase small subunit [Ardenticatenia bacterium]